MVLDEAVLKYVSGLFVFGDSDVVEGVRVSFKN